MSLESMTHDELLAQIESLNRKNRQYEQMFEDLSRRIASHSSGLAPRSSDRAAPGPQPGNGASKPPAAGNQDGPSGSPPLKREADPSQMQFRAFVEESMDAILLTTNDGKICFANAAAREMFRMTRREIADGGCEALIDKEDPRFARMLKERQESGRFRGELTLRRQDGSLFPAEVSSVAFRDEQGNQGAGMIVRDVGDKKKLERMIRQTRRMEAVSTLAQGIAHQMNNVLGVIIGNAELAIEDEIEKRPLGKYLREILDAGITGRDLMKQLLSLNGGIDEARRRIDCKQIIEDSLKLMRISIPNNVRLRQNVQELPCFVNAAPTHLFRATVNLCKNALWAMKGTGGVLTVDLRRVEFDAEELNCHPDLKPGPYIKLRVQDSGCGIAPEIMERIFDPYFSTRDGETGSGIGLAAVYGIVRDHGGGIEVVSELGKGTTFDLYFPALEKIDGDGAPASEAFKKGSERILFVDDEEALVKTQVRHLERLGYQVESTTDPEEALARFQVAPNAFDLVITDMSMPGMSGDRLVLEILKADPDARVILCTGYSRELDQEKALEIGVSAYVQKPITRQNMAQTIRDVLDGKSAR